MPFKKAEIIFHVICTLRKWKKLTPTPGFPTSTVKPKSANVLRLEACVALFPMWLLNFQIADTCTHCVPIFCFASCKISQNVKVLQLLSWSELKDSKEPPLWEAVEALCFGHSHITWWNNFTAAKINEAIGKIIRNGSKLRYVVRNVHKH